MSQVDVSLDSLDGAHTSWGPFRCRSGADPSVADDVFDGHVPPILCELRGVDHRPEVVLRCALSVVQPRHVQVSGRPVGDEPLWVPGAGVHAHTCAILGESRLSSIIVLLF